VCVCACVCVGAWEQNWAAEITKWLGDRLEGGVLALSESSRENVIEALNQYTMTGVYKVQLITHLNTHTATHTHTHTQSLGQG
jgi:hypothetical protein